jgi:cephalosporin hydroxylase
MQAVVAMGAVLLMGCGRGESGSRERTGREEAGREQAQKSAPSRTAEPAAERPASDSTASSLLGSARNTGLVQLGASAFERLTLEEKTLAYHLSRAAIAGDRIAYDQRYRHNLAIKDLLEAILVHADGVDPAVLEQIREYATLVWIHHGIHDAITARKFVPRFGPAELEAAARKAQENGATICTGEGCLATLLESLRRPIFDASFEPFTLQKSPPLSSYITLVEGSSTDRATVAKVRGLIRPGERVLVLLDSCHTKAHVRAELEAYAPLVGPGSYLVATDGIMAAVAGRPGSRPGWEWDNPSEAAREFAAANPAFKLEEPGFLFNEGKIEERVTYWPSAYLRRVA